MTVYTKNLTRRDFIIETAACAVGAWMGSSSLAQAMARSVPGTDPESLSATPHLALIIDDVGYNVSRVMPFLDLGVPITFSILPHLRYSEKFADKAHAEGHEVMLHQPMEPYNPSIDPGPGALYLTHDARQIFEIVENNLSSIPFVIGVNNHMGSRFTESREKTGEALAAFRERQLFFIDSFTSCNSIAFDTARDLDMIAAFRNVFIDNTCDTHYISAQLKKLKKHALKFGHAIGIGHPRPETVSALADFIDGLKGSRLSIDTASRVVQIKNGTT